MEGNKLYKMSIDWNYRTQIENGFFKPDCCNKYIMNGIDFIPTKRSNNKVLKDLILYNKTKDGYECYDGKKTFIIQNFDKEYNGDIVKSYCHHCRNGKNLHPNLKECHRDFYIESNDLNFYSGNTGFLLPKRIGCPTEIARYLFGMSNYDKQFYPVVNGMEYDYIETATRGALMWADNGFKGDILAYDINSFYSFFMNSKLKIPYKKGEFRTIDKFGKKIRYGIYKCKIDNYDIRVFRYNPKHYYTHIDIKFAIEQGYDVELIQEDNNFLYYNKDCLYTGSDI